MTSDTQPAPASKAMLWIGWTLSILPSLMLLFSGTMKLLKAEAVVTGFGELGYPERLILPLGIVEVVCTLVYLFPRTAVLGAILVTGYLGGAVATHARLLQPQFLAPFVLGVLAWGGLYLRDARVRALVPFRR
jgi:DoxX-like family